MTNSNNKKSELPNFVEIRSFLLKNVESILENLSARRQDRQISSDSLFGDFETANSSGLVLVKPEVLISEFEILVQEKDCLGLYVSGNPLKIYENLQAEIRKITARDDIYLVFIEKIKKIFTRSSQIMIALQITTTESSLEAIIFPKRAMYFSPILEEKELFWVLGKELRETQKKDYPEEEEGIENEAKSKISVEAIAKFNNGVLNLLQEVDQELSINRREQIEEINWQILKTQPELFNFAEAKKEVKSKQEKVLEIRIPQQIGPSKLSELKQILDSCKKPKLNSTLVKVYIEVGGEFKKVKSDYFMSATDLQEFKNFTQDYLAES